MCSQNGLGFLKFSIFEHVAFSLGSVIKIHLCKSVQVRAHRNKCGLSGAGAKWSARRRHAEAEGGPSAGRGRPARRALRGTPRQGPHTPCAPRLRARGLVPPGPRAPAQRGRGHTHPSAVSTSDSAPRPGLPPASAAPAQGCDLASTSVRPAAHASDVY